jgi:hypothetical protein
MYATKQADQRIAARYVPRDSTKEEHPDAGAVVYYSQAGNGRLLVVGYVGTAYHPAINYIFSSIERRAQYVDQWLRSLRASEARRQERREQRKTATHRLVVGDVVYSSWGYEQTNVDFFEVVRVVSDKSVQLRRIAKETTETGYMSGTTVPRKGDFLADAAPIVRRAEGERVLSIGDSPGSATKWDGRPLHCSWYA